MLHILILDEYTYGFEHASQYHEFIGDADNVKLLIITSPKQIEECDKGKYMAYADFKRPTNNGLVELLALQWHKEYRIDRIYTCQEEIVLRAAGLRKLLGLPGLQPSDALLFRDKGYMKRHLVPRGIPSPPFTTANTPSDIISFVQTNGYPIIIKPTLSCASVGIHILRNTSDLSSYLEKGYYSCISEQLLDHPGDVIVESFITGEMFHVNGHAENGKITAVWPFAYTSTNLEYTTGTPYGNISIPSSATLFAPLVAATQNILDNMNCGDHLFFHCELFRVGSEFQLCEIAARKAGSSICLLIDMLEGGKRTFTETEFRLSNGLKPRYEVNGTLGHASNECVGDLLIRRPLGRLIRLPLSENCPEKKLKIVPMAQLNTTYTGYDVNVVNTSMRFIASSPTGEMPVLDLLAKGHEWYNQNVEFSAV